MKTLILSALVTAVVAAHAAEQFACNLKGLTNAQHTRHAELTQTLLKSVVETSERPNGYAFRLDRSLLPLVAERVTLESKCCPFFSFQIDIEKREGPLWLKLTGSEGIKPFIRSEFQL